MSVFDKYAQNYDEGHTKAVALSGFTPDYFHEYKFKELVDYLKKEGLNNKKIKFLDFGCGIGRSVEYLKKFLPKVQIYGIDISKEEIRVANENNKKHKDVKFAHFDGYKIPFDTQFDVIFVANVFHHIKRNEQEQVLKEISKHLANNGNLFIFEHNPYNPFTIWIYLRNDFIIDKNSNLLSPQRTGSLLKKAYLQNNKLRFKIFFPQFLSFFIPFEKYIHWLPFGAHYYYIAKKSCI